MRTLAIRIMKLFVAVAIVKGLYFIYAKEKYEASQTQQQINRIDLVAIGTDTARMASFIIEAEVMMASEKQGNEFEAAVEFLKERYEYLKSLPSDAFEREQEQVRERERKRKNGLEIERVRTFMGKTVKAW